MNDFNELKDFLEEKVNTYNQPGFIPQDPISIPHLYSSKEDIEISGFLAAVIAWGQRPVILKNATQLLERMDHVPSAFIRDHQQKDRKAFKNFVHRTFNGIDCIYFLEALQQIYLHHDGLEGSFSRIFQQEQQLGSAISEWRKLFFSFHPPMRSGKHISDPLKNSSAKRICMYLRWMVRKDKAGVDFGLWNKIPASSLHAPLDIHSGRIARNLGILTRKQDDWKAVIELTGNLSKFDPHDPVKYDFALFGLGVNERF